MSNRGGSSSTPESQYVIHPAHDTQLTYFTLVLMSLTRYCTSFMASQPRNTEYILKVYQLNIESISYF